MIMFVNKFVDVLMIKWLVKLLLLNGEEFNWNMVWIIYESVGILVSLLCFF